MSQKIEVNPLQWTSGYSSLLYSFVVILVLYLMGVGIRIITSKIGPWAASRSTSNFINKAGKSVPNIVAGCQYSYGVSEIQGRRPYMEDRHLAIPQVNGNKSISLYGVFDGHGGSIAAEFCATNMDSIFNSSGIDVNKNKQAALEHVFKTTDEKFLELAQKDNLDCGTTAIVMLATDTEYTVANAGDSRALVVKRDGGVFVLSEDHKPERYDEKERIEKLGGTVVHWGVWRVEGVLAVSRAIGDRILKKYVIPDPEIKHVARSESDSFVVLATDGLWDVMLNHEVGLFLATCKDPQRAAELLVSEAFARGTMDNVTVMVVDVRDEGEKARGFAQLNKDMKQVEEQISEYEKSIELPQGGDLNSKKIN